MNAFRKGFHMGLVVLVCGLGTLGVSQAATLTVTNGSCDPALTGSMPWAVAQANANADADTIVITSANSITVFTALYFGSNITVEGRGATVGAYDRTRDVFVLSTGSSGSVLSDLAIVDGSSGVYIASNSNNNEIRHCCIGTDWANTAGRGNQYGIMTYGRNTIIGGGPSQRNIIAGNSYQGIYVNGAFGTRIQGNYIGLASNGITALPNSTGVFMYNSYATLVGGTMGGGGNVISGHNPGTGIMVQYGGGNTINGNVIGLSANQSTRVANATGIRFSMSRNNVIGEPGAGLGNVIAGNNSHGIYVDDSPGNKIQANRIGVNSSSVVLANQVGLVSYNMSDSLIGGNRAAAAPEGNIIAGNGYNGGGGNGVELHGGAGNSVSGNYLGTDNSGAAFLGNSYCGVGLYGGTALIGGANTDGTHQYGNIIAGQSIPGRMGIYINSAPGSRIQGNWIGVSPSGTAALPNSIGIRITGTGVLIGGSDATLGNVIAGNSTDGLILDNGGCQVLGNFFGTNASGTAVLANTQDALLLYGYGTKIGGTAPGERNIFCGTNTGINVQSAAGNTVVGNWFNVLADGTVPVTKFTNSIIFNGGTQNLIGLPDTHQGNLIVGGTNGIQVSGANAYSNGLFGNTVCGFTSAGILLSSNGNLNKAAPSITSGNACQFSGTSAANDKIEVFLADRAVGLPGGSLRFVGATVANGSGAWSVVPSGPVDGDVITALSTDTNNNTSTFANNVVVSGPTPTVTMTPTATPTFTPTPTPTVTRTATPQVGGPAIAFQAYPNPAKDKVTFVMTLDQAAEVKIALYNLTGEPVSVVSARLGAGKNQVVIWDCKSVAPGVYLAQVNIPGQSTRKVKLAIAR